MKYSTYFTNDIDAPSVRRAFAETSFEDGFSAKDEPEPPTYRPMRAEWTP